MNIFEWNDSYSVDIESIDSEHKGLFDLINQLYGAMSQGKGHEILNEIVDKLTDYTKVHFRREEFFFKATNYPEMAAHVLQHELFIKKVDEFKKSIKHQKLNVSVDVISFLGDWLINHIKISDKKYSSHLKKYHIK